MKLNTLTKLMKWFSAISLACAATSLVGVPVDIDYNGSLADETGGEAFFSGSDFVTFDPYFRELGEILENQWLITFREWVTLTMPWVNGITRLFMKYRR